MCPLPLPITWFLKPPKTPVGFPVCLSSYSTKNWGISSLKIQFLVGKLNLRLRVFWEEIGFWIGEISQFMFRLFFDMSCYVLFSQRLAVEYSSAVRLNLNFVVALRFQHLFFVPIVTQWNFLSSASSSNGDGPVKTSASIRSF